MTDGPVFTSRLTSRQLLDSDGMSIGRIRDVVILPTAGGDPPGSSAWSSRCSGGSLRQPGPGRRDLHRRRPPEGRHGRPETVEPADRGAPGLRALRPARRVRARDGHRHQPLRAAARRLGGHRAGHQPQPPRPAAQLHHHRAVGQVPRAVQGGCPRRAAHPVAGDAPTDLANAVEALPVLRGTSSSRRCRTKSWPTCWRRCPSRTRSGCWAGSAWSARPTWSRK